MQRLLKSLTNVSRQRAAMPWSDHMRIIGRQPVTALDLDDEFRRGGIGRPGPARRAMIRKTMELTQGRYRLKGIGNRQSYKGSRADEVAKRRSLISIGTSLAAFASNVL